MKRRRDNLRPFLSLRNATFRLGDRLVFERTTWTIHRQEQWAVIGANGSGKSLFADALRGRLPLVHGDLSYDFATPAGSTAEQAIAHVSFDERKAHLHGTAVQARWNSIEQAGALRVRQFLSFERVMDVNPFEIVPRARFARSQFERRRSRAIRLLRLEPFLERTVLSLSNGETQRVQLGQALCHPLRLLLLDEPFIGLDAATRTYFHGVLEQLMKTRVRVVLMTTRVEELPKHITHILLLRNCRVASAGPRGEIEQSLKRTAYTRHKTDGLGNRRVSKRGEKPAAIAAGHATELVKLRGATVQYGQKVILQDLNWTVREGENWAVLGRNGSGKSTLLSLICGDNPQAYRNQVEVFGRTRGSGESIWELKAKIGWVSPELHLHFDETSTCFEVVASGFHESMALYGQLTRRQREHVWQWMTRFGFRKLAKAPLFSLSTGQQRTLFLARALVKSPRLLLLDEPCQGLDGPHRRMLVDTVDRLLRSGATTAIYVTHRAEEIPPSIGLVLQLGGSAPAVKRWRT